MKKILFIIRKGFDADYLCSHLPRDNYDFYIVLESGRKARKKKLYRMFHRGRNVILTVMDLIALAAYDRIMTIRMKKLCRFGIEDEYAVAGNIADVNDEEIFNIAAHIRPDLICIYGTGILKPSTIRGLSAEIFNIHSSVLPAYRNVHSDFWAYRNRDFDKIGITIFKLSSGVDTGDIAMQAQNTLPVKSRLHEYKVWNLTHIIPLLNEFLSCYFDGKIVYFPQEEEKRSIGTTPTFEDLIGFWRDSEKDDK